MFLITVFQKTETEDTNSDYSEESEVSEDNSYYSDEQYEV